MNMLSKFNGRVVSRHRIGAHFDPNSAYQPQHLRKRSLRIRLTSVMSALTLAATLVPTAALTTLAELADNARPAAAMTGDISTIAGNGTAGYSGDGGPATSAELNSPFKTAADSAGNVYIADRNNSVVRKVSAGTGVITTFAGTGAFGYSGDGGPAASAKFQIPSSVALDAAGDVFIADEGSSSSVIRKVDVHTGIITTVAGDGTAGDSGDGGPATSAELFGPEGLAIDTAGDLFIDCSDNVVREVNAATGTITTVAGTGIEGYAGDGGPATSAEFGYSLGLAVDASNHLYIADTNNDRVRVVNLSTGIIGTFTGNGVFGDSGDGGPASDAEVADPFDVATDRAGDVFIAVNGGRIVREVSTSGAIATVAGNGSPGSSGDGGPATSAEFNSVTGVSVQGSNLYVADDANNNIREVNGVASVAVPGSVGPEEVLGGANPSEDVQQCQQGGYPVDCATGDFWHTFNDISIPGRGVPLSLARTYNSLTAGTDSPFGHGWSSNFDMSINYDSGTGNAVVDQENGSQVTFTDNGSGTFTAPPRVLANLVHNSDGTWTFTRRATSIFDFNSTGQLTAQKDLNGYTTSLSYPDSTHMTVTDPAGRTLSFVLDSNGHITGVTDPAGRTESFTYDGSGNLTDVIDVGGGHSQFTYDSNHQMLTMRSPRFYGDTTTSPSPVVTNVYDSGGRVTSQTDQLGRDTTFSYDDGANTTTVTDPKGNVEFEQYNGGLLTSLTKGYGTSSAATTTFTYDPSTAAVATATDPNGHTTSHTYDANGNQTGETDALGHSTSATYDSLNDQTSATDANGVTTTYTYDSDGNLLTKSQPLISGGTTENEVTTYTYGDSSHPGDVTKVTDPLGHSSSFTYDTYGDVASSTDADSNKTTYNYNSPTSIGWVMSQGAAKGNVPGATASTFTTTYTRDNYGRVLTTKDPDWTSSNPTAHIATNVYDADGNLTSATDGNGHTTTKTYDAAGELTKTTNPDSTTQQTSYYGDGSVHVQTDGNGHTTTYAYDPLGNLSSVTDPLSRTTSYVSDGAGNLINKINPGGTCSGTPSGCTTYSYDADNRMTGTTFTDGTHAVTYGYDNNGNKTSMTDGTGSSSYSYDTLDRLTGQTDGASNTVGYSYNRDSQVNGITYPGSHSVSRTYDNAGNFTALTDWLGHTDKFSYDPNGNQTSTQYGNDLTSASIYDQADQLTGISVGKGATATFAYTRNGNGSLTGTTATGVSSTSESFGYDSNNRLNNYNSQSLGYDNAGNMTTTDSGTTVAYDNANEVASVTTSGTPTSYSYNSDGDRTAAGSASYSYDQANRMTSYTSGSTSASYAYDGNGQRTSKTVGSTTNNFVYDNAEGTSQILSDGTNDYIYGPNGTPVEQINGSTVTYLQQDQLGSTRVLTDSSRNVVGTYSYDAYGNTTSHTGSATTPLEYAGQYLDAESGLYWMRARMYDPTTGSFTSVDPLASLTNASYGYAGDDPSDASDPSGLWPGQHRLQQALDLVAIPVYGVYYIPYQEGQIANNVGCSFGQAGCAASHLAVALTPIPGLEVTGLAGDAGLDWIKNETTGNGEAIFDEDAPGTKSHLFGTETPLIHGGPLVYLPGLYTDQCGNPHVNFEW